ncbi:MazG nucleotide pyrophosphohydrolase domain-containing protein [Paractinoplanes rishiriensis]|uniref:Pyrophosphatase n=1 Tax=Paractinoplanes rishiriensis TaxID=1050105 RepID=A0A919N215_9ACTN|nr:MazG nucleotide pyrophosphohydrolase domain-containing protein [Actinoplanes rishiriensis]GIE98362.1 pyrophosphatase [Actinoplanes rishiriensis]
MDLGTLSDDVERISQRYAEAVGFARDDAWYLLKLQEEVGELTEAYLAKIGQARAKDRTLDEREAAFRAELADVLCHVLLLARHHDVDLPAEITAKWLRWRR